MSDDENGSNATATNGGNGDKIGDGRLSRINHYFKALADTRRRHALYYLNEHRAESITLDELARHVKALETEHAPDTLVEHEYANVRLELYHNHLPRLADSGIIDYDSRRGDVRFDRSSRGLLILLWVGHLIERPP